MASTVQKWGMRLGKGWGMRREESFQHGAHRAKLSWSTQNYQDLQLGLSWVLNSSLDIG